MKSFPTDSQGETVMSPASKSTAQSRSCKGRLQFSGILENNSSTCPRVLRPFYNCHLNIRVCNVIQNSCGFVVAIFVPYDGIAYQYLVFLLFVFKDASVQLVQEQEPTLEELQAKIKDLEEKVKELKDSGNSVIRSQDDLSEMYRELLSGGSQLGGVLTITDKATITKEISKLKEHLNLGLRKNEVADISNAIRPLLFGQLVEKVKTIEFALRKQGCNS